MFLQKFCQKAQIQYDLNQPCVDGYLNPFRIHLIAPPLSKNVQLTLRRHKDVPWTLNLLKQRHWASEEQLIEIRKIIATKQNCLIIGSTGTGKTSCLNALINEIPEFERVIIIEDTHELKVPNQISTRLLTRFDLHGHLKSFNQEELIRQALRMRPNRLVIGEIRGREAKDLMLALSTGHAGSFGSLHAEDAKQALIRLEMLIKMGAPEWETLTIRKLIFLTLNYIICLGVDDEGNKKLKHLFKVAGLETHGVTLSKIF